MADTTVSFPIDAAMEPSAPADAVWLLEGLKNGNESAYEALVSRYQQPVYNLVYRLMDDPSEACDVVQEVFLKVFRNVGAFKGNSSLKTWIYRIAVNEAYNQRRWFSRHRRREVGLEAEEEGTRSLQDVLSDPGRNPFELASGAETREMVEQALADVSSVFRAAVVLRDLEDMSYEEVAEILQVSLGTVKSRILRGRDALRKALTERMEAGERPAFQARTAD